VYGAEEVEASDCESDISGCGSRRTPLNSKGPRCLDAVMPLQALLYREGSEAGGTPATVHLSLLD
jgi:hypothetical protein